MRYAETPWQGRGAFSSAEETVECLLGLSQEDPHRIDPHVQTVACPRLVVVKVRLGDPEMDPHCCLPYTPVLLGYRSVPRLHLAFARQHQSQRPQYARAAIASDSVHALRFAG